ncbi:MAG: histidine phosphatase family protein [Dehalococcoidales bacterium]|nr:MAG: histidine phosphatase family protein [Dehalococcoidales bacterium]
MQNVYVVTHAQSLHHIQDLTGGWYDTSLTEKGINQAEKLAEFLTAEIGIPGIPIYSSDLKRAVETAEIIARPFKSSVIRDKRLREMSFGDAEGKPGEWRTENILLRPLDGDRLNHRIFKNAETRKDVGTRISECLDEIIAKNDENLVIVSHGNALTFIIMAWFKVPVENMDYGNFRAAPARITYLHEDDLYGNRNVVYVCREMY